MQQQQPVPRESSVVTDSDAVSLSFLPGLSGLLPSLSSDHFGELKET